MTELARSKPLSTLGSLVGVAIDGSGDTAITSIAYDSRAVEPGSLFVAMPGGYVDGHDYIDRAISNGAVAVLAERGNNDSVPHLVVPDSRAALSAVSAAFYDYPSRELGVVGITGTDGKTSTSTLAEAMLSRHGFRTGLIGTISIKIGDETLDHETRQTTPESLDVQRLLRRMVDEGLDWVVLEATSHGLAMHRLDHVEFDIAAVTNMTHEHIDFHGTRDAYWQAKARLFEMTTRNGGRAVVNLDDEGARSVLQYAKPESTLTYSMTGAEASVIMHDISLGIQGYSSTLSSPYGTKIIQSPLLGAFNVANSLCAAGIAISAGAALECIVETLAAPPVIHGRMAAIDEGQSFSVVVDYAHTPASLEKVLTLLRSISEGGRLIVVSGSAGERDREKRPLQGAVCAKLADLSIFTSEDPRYEDATGIVEQIAEGARLAGSVDGLTMHRIVDRAEAIQFAMNQATTGDTVLLAGKGHERSIIANGAKIPWDEAAVAREALRSLLAEKGS